MFRLNISSHSILVPIPTKDEAKAIMLARSFMRDHNFYDCLLEKHSHITNSFRVVCRIKIAPLVQPDNIVVEDNQLSIGW